MRVGKQKSKIALNYLVLPPICYLSRKEDRQLTACTEYLLRKTDFSSEQLGKEIQIILRLLLISSHRYVLSSQFKLIQSITQPPTLIARRAFNNYLRGQFLYPKRGQKQIFFDPLPPHLVHVVIECHLAEKED